MAARGAPILTACALAFAALAVPLAGAQQPGAQLPLSPADARTLFAAAERLRFAEDWYGAVDTYLAALAKNPSYGEALVGLAECYYALEEYDQALVYVKRAAPFRKGDPSLLSLEGFVLLSTGDLAGSRKAYESALSARPNDLDARFGLALLDMAAGRPSQAQARLEDSLRISPQNGRAILSLALIAAERGMTQEARALVEKALRWHGADPRTQLVAARLASAEGDAARAAFHARNAIELKPSFGEARLLLGSLMYETASYGEAIALMREAVALDRGDGMAWYTLGLAQVASGRHADAIYSLRAAVAARPDDELARIALEYAVMDSSPVEDASREAYAEWHFRRGEDLADRSQYDQALFEFRRGLKIYPYSKRGRLLYAGLLKARGFEGKYLDELGFLKDIGRADQAVLDEIEIYDSLLRDSLGRSWGIDEALLAKRPHSLTLVYSPQPGAVLHAAGEELLLRYAKDLLSSSSRVRVLPGPAKVAGLAEAFRRARESGADYVAILSGRETERDLKIEVELRVARTGSVAASFQAYRTGNDRVKNGADRVVGLIASSLPPEGRLLMRNLELALVDLGAADGLEAGAALLVIKKGGLEPKPEGLGHSYQASSVVGELTLTRVGEEVAEGRLKSALFFDTINIGDEIVLAPKDGQVPATPGAASSAAQTASPEGEWPGLFAALKKLR